MTAPALDALPVAWALDCAGMVVRCVRRKGQWTVEQKLPNAEKWLVLQKDADAFALLASVARSRGIEVLVTTVAKAMEQGIRR